MKKRTVALLCSCALLAGVAISSTMAWLTSTPDAVINTFTVGNIEIDLWEHDYNPDDNTLENETSFLKDDLVKENTDYNFVPGDTLPKDPFVVVDAGSEDCWLFVRVEENNNRLSTDSNAARIADFDIDSGWTQITDTELASLNDRRIKANTSYWYRTHTRNATEDIRYFILDDPANNNTQIDISPDLTKEIIADLNLETNRPQLIFKAAAIQQDHVGSWQEAWAIIPEAFFNDK